MCHSPKTKDVPWEAGPGILAKKQKKECNTSAGWEEGGWKEPVEEGEGPL